jgi:hypothetical protein
VEVPTEESLLDRIHSLLASLHPYAKGVDRRQAKRFPYPHLVSITPVGADGSVLSEQELVVAGKHISEGGLGFFHPNPLSFRKVVCVLQDAEEKPLRLLMDLSWCRFTKQGWYESGGRFLQIIAEDAVPSADGERARCA